MNERIVFSALVLMLLLSCVEINCQFIKPVGSVTTWTVDDDGPADFSTIQEAINAYETLDGHTIQVAAGIYYENLVVNKTLSLFGEGRESTIIDGSKQTGSLNPVIAIEANAIVVANFTIRNSVPSRAAVQIYGHNGTTIQKNSITGNGIGIVLDLNSCYNNITDNILADNSLSISLYSGPGNQFFGNTITNSSIGVSVENIYTDGNTFCRNLIEDNFFGVSVGAVYMSLRVVDINNSNESQSPVYPNPCSHADFRHALWHTMDRQHVVNNLWADSWHPMYTPVPSSVSEFVHPDIAPGRSLENITHSYNLTEASRILDATGFIDTDGDGWRNFPAALGGDEENIVLNYRIAAWDLNREHMGYWHVSQIESIGIIVNETLITPMERNEKVLFEKDFHLFTGGWLLLPWTPIGCLTLYHSRGYSPDSYGPNYGHVSSTEYDQSVDKLIEARAFDDAVQASLNAQEIFNNPECVGAIPVAWQISWSFEISNNTFLCNTIANNLYGMYTAHSSENLICNNSFVNNSLQVFSNSSVDYWQGGDPPTGNYWSSHNPPDEDKDKIGDEPFIIDENNTDLYPLIYPFEFYEPGYAPMRDINIDGAVNIVDIAIVAMAFGTKPGGENWNPIADLDINETINIVDVSTVAMDYGKTV